MNRKWASLNGQWCPMHVGLLESPLGAAEIFFSHPLVTSSLGSCCFGCPRGTAFDWGQPPSCQAAAHRLGQLHSKYSIHPNLGPAPIQALPGTYGEQGMTAVGTRPWNMHGLALTIKPYQRKVMSVPRFVIFGLPHQQSHSLWSLLWGRITPLGRNG